MEGTNTFVSQSSAPGKLSEVHTLKEHEMHISELKKENFELKLRIYFLEEKLQLSQRDVDDDDTSKMNIELKVEIEKLKSELSEKRRLLVKASNAVDSLDRNNQEQIKKLKDHHTQDLEQVKGSYEIKLRENEEMMKTAMAQSEQLKEKLIETERINRQIKDDKLSKDGPSAIEATEIQATLQAKLREKDRIIDELKSAVDIRESRIKLLSKGDKAADAHEQIKGLKQKIEERDSQIMDLIEKLKKAETSVKELKGSVYESDRKFQLASQETITATQKLNEKLRLKQTELDEVQEKFRILQQNLEKAQDIIDEASLKDVEAFEEKSKALKMKDALIAELQGNLKQKEMENDHLIRSMARKDKELQKMSEKKDMQEDVAHQIYEKEKELTVLSEQLTNVKAKLRESADQHDEQLQKLKLDHESQLRAKDHIIHRVTETLEDKESIIQDLIVTQENLSLSSSRDDITDTKEEMIEKLRSRLKERDAVVEANIEEKFQALHNKEEEIQELRKCLRERDRLIENINAAVLSNEDLAKNLQSALEEKTALINGLRASEQIQQNQFTEANEAALKRSRENEGLIEKLKRNLANREQQIENLKNVLHRNATEAEDSQEKELLNGLSATLKEKEKLVTDLLAERSAMTADNEANHQKMMNAFAEKEDLLKVMSDKMNQISSEKNIAIGRLQQQVNNLNLDVQAVENSKMWAQQEHEILLGKLKQSLVEKDRTIEKLINSGKEKDKVFLKLQEVTSNRATSPVRLEMVELERELHQKDSLLKQAAETIEDFQAKLNNLPVLEELKESLTQTESALNESEKQRKKLQSDFQNAQEQQLQKVQSLEKEIISLQEEKESWKLQREDVGENSSKDQVGRLEELLHQQIQETGRLGEILKREREAYEDAIKHSQPGSNNLQGKLKLISELRQSLEEGIVQNNKLRAQLQEEIAQGKKRGTSKQKDEVERLQAKLEDSERWNMSLQSRLDALQPRSRGVGGSDGNISVIGIGQSQSENAELHYKQMEEMKSRLNEAHKLNTRLQGQLEKAAKTTLDEKTGLNQLNEQQKQEIMLLRQELKKVNNSCAELRTARKKADAEIASYKKEHDIEFNTLKRALEDSKKFNESLEERLKEAKKVKDSQASLDSMANRTSSPINSRESFASTNDKADDSKPKDGQRFFINDKTSSPDSVADRTSSASGVAMDRLPNKLANTQLTTASLQEDLEKELTASLNAKLPKHVEKANQTSFHSPEGIESLASKDTARIIQLQKELEEKQKVIDSLAEELSVKEVSEGENFGTFNGTNGKKSSSLSTSKVNQLEKELAESRNVIQSLKDRLEMTKQQKQSQTSFEKSLSMTKDVVDGPDTRQSGQTNDETRRTSQLRKELEDVYKKNEELRKAVSENIALVELNRQLKQDLTTSEQRGGLLEKELQNYANELTELNDEVDALSQDLTTAKALNSDYVSQLKTLKEIQEQATRFREEAVSARGKNEKLRAEVQRLFTSLESVGKENERLKEALSPSKLTSQHTLASTPSPTSRNDQPSPRAHQSRELQALREKLNLSERLNTALKYELEANKRILAKSGSSDEPLMGHLEELRQLRARLEESIRTYDELCLQLEEKLKEIGKEEGKEGVLKDSVSLMKENESLKLRVAQCNEDVRLIQQQLEEHRLTRKRDKEQITVLNSKLSESNKTNEGLRNELAICDSVIKLSQKSTREGSDNSSGTSNSDAIMLLLAEIRSLRQQLEASILSNNSLRQMLQKQLSSSPQRAPALDARPPEHGQRSTTSPMVSSVLELSSSSTRSSEKNENLALESSSLQELRQYINSSFQNAETLLVKIMRISLEEHDLGGKLDELKIELESLRTLLFKSVKLVEHLWAEHQFFGPTTTHRLTKQNDELRKEILSLKKRVLSQSKILENTANRLESSSRMRKEVERSLFARLSETRDTIGTSRKQLEDRLASKSGS